MTLKPIIGAVCQNIRKPKIVCASSSLKHLQHNVRVVPDFLFSNWNRKLICDFYTDDLDWLIQFRMISIVYCLCLRFLFCSLVSLKNRSMEILPISMNANARPKDRQNVCVCVCDGKWSIAVSYGILFFRRISLWCS